MTIKCDNLTYEECELAILRSAVDTAEKRIAKQTIHSDEIKNIIRIVEEFLKRKKLVCYGGTAINALLPKEDKFYDEELELPDYDFFSPSPVKDAKELADIYYNNGFVEVEAKAGMHYGTYKVFVNFIPVADITLMNKSLFNSVKSESISISGIHYAPPNYLRMAMYLELSRPEGDVSRWEKILRRLTLLNKNYPLKQQDCKNKHIQREFRSDLDREDDIFEVTRKALINKNAVFFGGYANILYSKYMPQSLKKKIQKIPDFDVLSERPFELANYVKERLEKEKLGKVKIYEHEGVGELISPHYELEISGETILFIYEPIACHSYNVIKIDNEQIRIATIDTMLSLYLAFLYADRDYYDRNRLICMAYYLFVVQQKNRLKQKGLLRRFSINCYGKQKTLMTIRAEKAEQFKKLSKKKHSRAYDEWFLRYIPREERKRSGTRGKIKKTKKRNKTRKK